jgi:hypothetical protein
MVQAPNEAVLIMRQLVHDIERCAGVADVVTVPPLCPIQRTPTTSPIGQSDPPR